MFALQVAFAILAPLLQVCIVLFMWKRHLHREYVAFFTYTLWQIARAAILIWLWYEVDAGILKYAAYFYFYWAAELLSTTLALAVIRSIFISVSRGYRATRQWGEVGFLVLTAMLLAVCVAAAHFVPTNNSSSIIAAVLVLERSVLIMQAGLLLLFLLFSSVLGISLRHKLFGISFGFGIYASVHLISAAIRAFGGADYDSLFRISKTIAYNIAVCVWFVYVCLPEREPRIAQLPATNVSNWNETLLEILK